jgi:hypothetical protein
MVMIVSKSRRQKMNAMTQEAMSECLSVGTWMRQTSAPHRTWASRAASS